jgi:hypothetical protein
VRIHGVPGYRRGSVVTPSQKCIRLENNMFFFLNGRSPQTSNDFFSSIFQYSKSSPTWNGIFHFGFYTVVFTQIIGTKQDEPVVQISVDVAALECRTACNHVLRRTRDHRNICHDFGSFRFLLEPFRSRLLLFVTTV